MITQLFSEWELYLLTCSRSVRDCNDAGSEAARAGFKVRVCRFGLLHGPSLGRLVAVQGTLPRVSHQLTGGHRPRSENRPIGYDAPHPSHTYNFACDHHFWMRFPEKCDLSGSLVPLDERPGLLTSPSTE